MKCEQHRKTYPYALFCDNSKNAYERKREAFKGVRNLTIVVPCEWMRELVEKSFLKEYPVKVIYNGTDSECFYPDRKRDENESEKIVLGVANIWEKRKGLDYFKRLSRMLDGNYRIVLVGMNFIQRIFFMAGKKNTKVTLIRKTQSISELRRLYSNADVFVNPTLEDNFPTTNIEALSCGTPVITFNTGGSPESIAKSCGRVIDKGNLEEMKVAVEQICSRPKSNARDNIAEMAQKFSQDGMLKRYWRLYESLL